jgi:hypothetical protein
LRLVRRSLLVALIVLASIGLATASAGADGPVGADPSQNYPAGPMPATCEVDGTPPACVDAAVNYLDQARASLNQPAYQLPTNFDSLSPDQQNFVLANLDRVLYGLPPIPGMNAALGQDAMQGVQTDSDPAPSDPNVISYTSNWAGNFANYPLAYEAWMYDDGPGSGNLDCTAANSSGCWGHRHDVLWQFDQGGALAMGVASGKDSLGRPGYAMLIVEGDSDYHPSFTYTWAQAVAAGARPVGTAAITTSPARPATKTKRPAAKKFAPRISRVRVSGRTVRVAITAPTGTRLQCALTHRAKRSWSRDRWRKCSASPVYRRLARGRYRLRVRSATGLAARVISVR